MKRTLGVATGIVLLLSLSCETPTTEITIYHTNDLHSAFRAPKLAAFNNGGFAKIAAEIKRLRAENPVSLLIDAGDWSEGRMYFNNDSGSNTLKFMQEFGTDAAALGNHDYLSGPDQIIETIRRAGVNFPILAANLKTKKYSNGGEFEKQVLPSVIKEVGGLKVGIIGLTTYEFIYDSYIKPVEVLNPVESLKDEVKRLRSQVDLIVVTSHNSFTVNKQLAKIPGVDAIISGHSHVKINQAELVNNGLTKVPVVETGEWGQYFGELKLRVNRVTKTAKVVSYRLRPVSPELPEDQKVAQMIRDEEDKLSRKYGDVRRVIAQADFNIEKRLGTNVERTLPTLTAKAYTASVPVDFALESSHFTGVNIVKGPVTFMDAHDVIPHLYNAATGREWTIQVWEARGLDVLKAFNVFFANTAMGWPATDGIQVTWDPGALSIGQQLNRVFDREVFPLANKAFASSPVKAIEIGGQPLDVSKRYRVALTDGILSALKIANDLMKADIDISRVSDTGIEAWKSVVDYIATKRRLTIDDLRASRRAPTISPNLAMYSYNMNYDGKRLSLRVDNLGLVDAEGGEVICRVGLVDNQDAYETTNQKWTEFYRAPISRISALSFEVFETDWSYSDASARYIPIQCEVASAQDKFLLDNIDDILFEPSGN